MLEAPRLRTWVAIETGDGIEETGLEPFHTLAQGQAGAAFAQAASLGEGARLLRVLCLASDRDDSDANNDLEADPADLEVQEDDDLPEILASFALAARSGRSTEAHATALHARLQETAVPVLDFLTAVQQQPPAALAELTLVGTDLPTYAMALSAAVVIRGEEAPPAWRTTARKLAWVGERPYLAP